MSADNIDVIELENAIVQLHAFVGLLDHLGDAHKDESDPLGRVFARSTIRRKQFTTGFGRA